MCTQKPPHDYSEQLYARYREAFEKYIQEKVCLFACGRLGKQVPYTYQAAADAPRQLSADSVTSIYVHESSWGCVLLLSGIITYAKAVQGGAGQRRGIVAPCKQACHVCLTQAVLFCFACHQNPWVPLAGLSETIILRSFHQSIRPVCLLQPKAQGLRQLGCGD